MNGYVAFGERCAVTNILSYPKHSHTPLYNAVYDYVLKDRSRFHTPGHMGLQGGSLAPLEGAVALDLTEIPGLDSLYEATGVLGESEALYTQRYQSKATYFSAGGSTLCIQAMLALVARPGGKIIVGRNAHTSVIHALALLNLEPVWIALEVDGETGLPTPITPTQVAKEIERHQDLCGVFITSPDYYGSNSDVKEIAEVCHKENLPLLVDGAHGAHYKFLKQDCHPISLGADLCCNSLHKTMPTLTGAALLHIGNDKYVSLAKQRMALFGSTSPSYLILLSIDLLLPTLYGNVEERLSKVTDSVAALQALARKAGYAVPHWDCDPARLTIGFGGAGFTAEEFAQLLAKFQLEPEYMDDYYAVFLPGFDIRERDWNRLRAVLSDVHSKGRKPRPVSKTTFTVLPEEVPLSKAMFAPAKQIPVEHSAGKIASGIVAPCPPGIPLVIPGEKILPETVEQLKKTGISTVGVIQYL